MCVKRFQTRLFKNHSFLNVIPWCSNKEHLTLQTNWFQDNAQVDAYKFHLTYYLIVARPKGKMKRFLEDVHILPNIIHQLFHVGIWAVPKILKSYAPLEISWSDKIEIYVRMQVGRVNSYMFYSGVISTGQRNPDLMLFQQRLIGWRKLDYFLPICTMVEASSDEKNV